MDTTPIPTPLRPSSVAPLARLAGARKRHGAVQALDGIDLAVAPGEVLALLGANGAGKSTAISLLLGLARPDAGTAELLGSAPGSVAARQGMGVMLQAAGLPDTNTVGELLAVTRSYYPSPRSVADCVALAGLDGLLDRRYGRLSGGQQRRVQFALALCGDPRVLFLDEPTTGLDIDARQTLWRAIGELVARGVGVLLTTHYLEEAEALADRVVVLQAGRVVASGAMESIRAQVSTRRVRCRTTLDGAIIGAWPGVQGVQRDGAYVACASAAAEDTVRRLLAADPALADLEVQRAGLAEAFLDITRAPQAVAA